MFNLLQSNFCNLTFTKRRALGFLDETVQHHDPLSNESTKENTGNALCSLVTQLEETIAKGFCMGFAEIWTQGNHPASQHDIPCS